MRQPRRLKKDKRFKDAPRFPVIYAYEDAFKDSYNTHAKMMVADLTKQMVAFTKQQKGAAINKAIDNGDLEFETRDIGGEICYYYRHKGATLWTMLTKEQYDALASSLGLKVQHKTYT